MSRADQRSKTVKGKGLKVRRIVIIALLVLLAFFAAALGLTYLYLNSKLKNIETLEEVNEEGEVVEYTETELSCVDVDGFINILLIGIDSRDMSSMEGWRADAIIIASIKEETGEVYLTSVYRDSFLMIGDGGFYDKVTHSFYYGGMKDTIKTLNQSLDLNIKNYVVFNFKAVADVIDAMGGLDINIEEYEINELNYANRETCIIIGQEDIKVVTEPGLQHIDGAQAVTYGRIRHGVGDDFKRTERMRTVIAKVMEKVKTMSFGEIDKLIDIGIGQIRTNLSNSDIIGLGMRASKFKIAGSEGFPYTLMTGTLDGVSYVFPYDLYGDVAALHENFFGQKGYTPSDKVSQMSYEILLYYANTENQNEIDITQYYENPSDQPQLLDWTDEENSTTGRPADEIEGGWDDDEGGLDEGDGEEDGENVDGGEENGENGESGENGENGENGEENSSGTGEENGETGEENGENGENGEESGEDIGENNGDENGEGGEENGSQNGEDIGENGENGEGSNPENGEETGGGEEGSENQEEAASNGEDGNSPDMVVNPDEGSGAEENPADGEVVEEPTPENTIIEEDTGE